jgi:NAD(P)H-dependent FMN reductase
MSKLQIIIGSTCRGGVADQAAPPVIGWAQALGGSEAEVRNQRDWPLPIFAEHLGSIGDFNDHTYRTPIVREYNRKIKQADAYPVITPEEPVNPPATQASTLGPDTSREALGRARRRLTRMRLFDHRWRLS